MAFSQVNDAVERHYGADKFMISIDALKGRLGQHLAVIKDLVPDRTRQILQTRGIEIFDQQHLAAAGANIVEIADGKGLRAAKATIHQLTPGLRDKVRLNRFWKVIPLH
jgi:hypothetical protein